MGIFKRILSIFLRISISIILLILLFKVNKINVSDLSSALKSADKYLFFTAFFVFFFVYILCFYRWQMLLNTAKVHISLRRTVISFAGGVCFSLVLPSSIGGDLIRSIDLSRHTNKPKEVIATVLLDRLSGYVGLVILLILSLFFGWRFVKDNKIVVVSAIIITGLLLTILLVLFNRFAYSKVNELLHSPNAGKIRELIKDLHQEMHLFRHHKVVLANNLFFSLFVQAISSVSAFIVALSLGIKVNIIYFFIFMPIIGVVTLLPISIGGAGIREWMTVLLFKNVGVDRHLAAGLSLINFSFILVYGAIGGLIYVLTVHHRRIQPHKSQAVHSHQ